MLGVVKTEFGKFGKVLDGIQRNLHHAATKIDEARKGTRKIERKLTHVEELPVAEAVDYSMAWCSGKTKSLTPPAPPDVCRRSKDWLVSGAL